MNVLFLTLMGFNSLKDNNIYTDLLREFVRNNHKVYVISPIEKREKKGTQVIREENTMILRLLIGNIQKTNPVEKGINTVLVETKFKEAIRKYYSDIRFDLVLYTTPPITLVSAVEYVKRRDNAKAYLLLKDIFPQNAVDIGLMKNQGIKGLIYYYFRKKEKRLYAVSDKIGCMSQANADYLISQNSCISPSRVEICPNSIEAIDKSIDQIKRIQIRDKYNIPRDCCVFVYGGNLGKPQDIPFVIECLIKCSDLSNAFFLIIGDGTEYELLDSYIKQSKQKNIRLMKRLPKEDYDTLVSACDAGLIFLDHRFTIPNFPSRILRYMQAKIPVIAATDSNTDIGDIIIDGGFGWWCESTDASAFNEMIKDALNEDLTQKGINGWDYLIKNYSSAASYNIIINAVEKM